MARHATLGTVMADDLIELTPVPAAPTPGISTRPGAVRAWAPPWWLVGLLYAAASVGGTVSVWAADRDMGVAAALLGAAVGFIGWKSRREQRAAGQALPYSLADHLAGCECFGRDGVKHQDLPVGAPGSLLAGQSAEIEIVVPDRAAVGRLVIHVR